MVRTSAWTLVYLAMCLIHYADLLVIPEDVPMGLVAIYGFAPKIVKGNDHRVGFGFRFGNHADFQVLYEFGPQMLTKPLEPLVVRPAAYTLRQRTRRRRPFIELLLRSGLLRGVAYRFSVTKDDDDGGDDEVLVVDEPR